MTFQRRLLLCRVGFVLLCIVPTISVGGWTMVRTFAGGTAAAKSEWERELTSRLGLIAQLDRVHYPQRSLAWLVGLKLLDPETGSLVAEASQIDVAAAGDGWQITPSHLVLEAKQLPLFARVLQQRLFRGPIPSDPQHRALHIALAPRDLLLRSFGHDQTLEQVGGDLELSPDGVKLAVHFHLPDARGAAEPVWLTTIRDRTHAPPRTDWQLVTQGASLPCQLASDFAPQLAHLGRDCQFSGLIQLQESPDGTRGQIAGTITNVDLDALVTEQFPHQLSGQATVRIDQALMDKGKLVELRGTVQAHHGAISPSLVAAAAEHLGLAPGPATKSPPGPIAFRQLSADFRLTGPSLALAGHADPLAAGVLIASASGPILTAPKDHTVAAMALLRALLPDSALQVPATRQTASLINSLPVPDIVPAAAATPPSHTPTRLTPAPAEPAEQAVRQPVLR